MSGQAQPEVDYDALAQQARSQTASKPVTKKFVQPVVDYDALASQARQTSAPAASAQSDLTFNTKGEGLYRMGSYDFNQGQVTKPEIQVPYSRVQDAIAAGYNLHPDEAPRYQKDSTHEGQGPTTFEHVKSLLSRMTEPMPDTPLQGSPFQQAAAAMGNAAKLPANIVNRTLRGVAGLPQGVTQTVTGISRGDPAALESLNPATMGENATRGLSEDTSNLGPMAALGNFGGDVATMYLAGEYGPKVVESTTKPIVSAAKSVYGAPETVARFMTDTGRGPVERLVKDTQAENKVITGVNEDRIAKQQKDQAQADADYRDKVSKLAKDYDREVDAAKQAAATGTDADRAEYQTKQTNAKAKYDRDVHDAQEQYQTKKKEIEQANAETQQKVKAKADQAARIQYGGKKLIEQLQQLSRDVRTQANARYAAVRAKMMGASIPSDALADVVKTAQEKWIRGSPTKVAEFNAMLSTGSPGPELVLADQTAQNMGYKNFRTAIANPAIRSTLSRALPPDVWKAAIGQGTRPISWNDLQGFYEETGAKIAEGPQPGKGDIYKAVQQVHDRIGDLMQQLAKTRGVEKEFASARAFYRDYMRNFNEPTGPSGSGSPIAQALRAKDPEVAVEKFAGIGGDERGVGPLRRYNMDTANLAQYLRNIANRKIPTPGELKQFPVEPNPPALRLSEGAPIPRVAETVPYPSAHEPPVVPLDLKPLRTISTGDITAARQAAAEASAGKWWRRGEWAAAVPIFQAMRGFWGGHIPSLPIIGLESAGVLATSRAAAEFLRYPPMIRFLTQARPEDIALIPADMRGDLPGLVSQAQRYGIKVSPPLAAVAAGATNQPGDRQTFTPDQAIQAMQPVLAGATQ